MDFFEKIQWDDQLFHSLIELLMGVGIGLLLGMEREFAKRKKEEDRLFAGVRTFPIVTLLGYIGLKLGDQYGIWIFVAAFAGVLSLIALAYLGSQKKGQGPGTTTEFSLIIAFLMGGLVYSGQYHLAVSVTLVVMFLLTFKAGMHVAVEKLAKEDIVTILQFLLLTALVLPLLPNQAFDAYGVFNPFRIWLVVSIFLSLNFVTYFLGKFLAKRHSALLVGVLGGFASSTTTAWYFSRRTRGEGSGGALEASAIVLAASIMFPRLAIWLLILNESLFKTLAIPVLILGAAGVGLGIWLSKRQQQGSLDAQPATSPLNIKEALIFGAVYLGIQWLVFFADQQWGDAGIYIAATLSGITDMDAITISMAEFGKGMDKQAMAALAIWIAAFTNTLVKYSFCLLFGSPALKKYSSYAFVPLFVLGLAVGGYLLFQR